VTAQKIAFPTRGNGLQLPFSGSYTYGLLYFDLTTAVRARCSISVDFVNALHRLLVFCVADDHWSCVAGKRCETAL